MREPGQAKNISQLRNSEVNTKSMQGKDYNYKGAGYKQSDKG